jgi:hypothetical protein
MDMEIPSNLYKYQPYSSYALEGLVKGAIWVSDPNTFNDPFDGKYNENLNITPEQVRQYSPTINKLLTEAVSYPLSPSDSPFFPDSVGYNVNWEAYDESDDEEKERIFKIHCLGLEHNLKDLAKAGVYSLTEEKDDLLMWAHYADSHRGFVIGYDSSEEMETYLESPHLLPVEYSDEYPKYSIEDFLSNKMNVIQKMAVHKGRQWEHEKEWRILFPRSNATRKMPWPISGIIFGHRMQHTHKDTIYELMTGKSTNIVFFEAVPSKSMYKLDIQPFTRRPKSVFER